MVLMLFLMVWCGTGNWHCALKGFGEGITGGGIEESTFMAAIVQNRNAIR
jgi:hypothetical protein